MSEMEQLKENAHKQKFLQQIDELNAYIDSLFKKLDEAMAARRRWNRFEAAMAVTWIISIAAATLMDFWYLDVAREIAFLGWFLCVLHSWSGHYTETSRIFGEIDGAFEVLRILGYMPPKGETRKEPSVWEKGKEMVEDWSRQKEEAQSGVLAPA